MVYDAYQVELKREKLSIILRDDGWWKDLYGRNGSNPVASIRENVCAQHEYLVMVRRRDKRGSIPLWRIVWNSTHILCGGMTVIGGVVAELVGWSTHLFVSGRGFESFRYDGAELMWYCMRCAVAYREYGARCPHICPHSSMVEQSLCKR